VSKTLLFLGLASGLAVMARPVGAGSLPADVLMGSPRGVRNNNPGNIEYSPVNEWQGQTGTDGRYSIFSSPFYGIRALARLIFNYRTIYGLRSVAGIVSRWAPAFENDTQAYIAAVSSSIGVEPYSAVPDGKVVELVAAIIHHENGQQPYSGRLIRRAVRAAGNE